MNMQKTGHQYYKYKGHTVSKNSQGRQWWIREEDNEIVWYCNTLKEAESKIDQFTA